MVPQFTPYIELPSPMHSHNIVNVNATHTVVVDEYEEDVWVNPYTMEEVATNLWMPGNPNGGAKENCARTYIGKFAEKFEEFFVYVKQMFR